MSACRFGQWTRFVSSVIKSLKQSLRHTDSAKEIIQELTRTICSDLSRCKEVSKPP